MTLVDYAIFLGCVAIACFAQNLTGFAFGLIFIGLISVFNTIDLLTAANVISILSLANAIPMLKSDSKTTLPVKPFSISLSMSLIGVALGLLMLNYLTISFEVYLKILLALTILIASFLLILQKKTPTQMSSPVTFASFGLLSGILGGLFSTAGPPLVYLMYKQPLLLNIIKRFLILSFAANAVLRIALVVWQGQMNHQIIGLSAIAFPFVYLLSLLQRHYPIKWPIHVVKKIVFCLLVLTAFTLLIPAVNFLINS